MNRLPPDRVQALFECFAKSMGIRAAARAAKTSKESAARYLKAYEAGKKSPYVCVCGKPLHVGWCKEREESVPVAAWCACGKPLRHRGWCSIRFARSPARQAVVRNFRRSRAQLSPPPSLPPPSLPPPSLPPPSLPSPRVKPPPLPKFAFVSAAIPNEKQMLREMLAAAVRNTPPPPPPEEAD